MNKFIKSYEMNEMNSYNKHLFDCICIPLIPDLAKIVYSYIPKKIYMPLTIRSSYFEYQILKLKNNFKIVRNRLVYEDGKITHRQQIKHFYMDDIKHVIDFITFEFTIHINDEKEEVFGDEDDYDDGYHYGVITCDLQFEDCIETLIYYSFEEYIDIDKHNKLIKNFEFSLSKMSDLIGVIYQIYQK